MNTFIDALIIVGAFRADTDVLTTMIEAVENLTRWTDYLHQAFVVVNIIEGSRRASRDIFTSFCEIVKILSFVTCLIDHA